MDITPSVKDKRLKGQSKLLFCFVYRDSLVAMDIFLSFFFFFSVTFTFAEIPPSFDLAEEDDLMESVNKWFAGTSDHIDRQAADTTKYQGKTPSTKYQGQAPSVKTRGLKLCN